MPAHQRRITTSHAPGSSSRVSPEASLKDKYQHMIGPVDPSTQAGPVSAGLVADESYTIVLEDLLDAICRKNDRLQLLIDFLPHILAITGADAGALFVSDQESGLPATGHRPPGLAAGSAEAIDQQRNLVVVAKKDMPDELLDQFMHGDWGQQLLAGHPIYQEQKMLQLHHWRAVLGRHKLKFLFGYPLSIQGETLGAILVASHKSEDNLMPAETRKRLEPLAHLLTLFLDNTRLRANNQHKPAAVLSPGIVPETAPPADTMCDLEELLAAVMSAEEEVASQNKDLGFLNTLANEVSGTLNLNSALTAAIEKTRAALNADAGWIYIYENEVLTLVEQQGLSDRYTTVMKQLSPGDGVEGMAFGRGEPVLRDALLFHSGQKRATVEAEGLRAVAAAPLLGQGKTLGVLSVGSLQDRAWSPRDERMLVSISEQVAQAISNSQSFARVQQQAQKLEDSYLTLQQANQQLARRAENLEREVQELRQAEQQIWIALAASQEARLRPSLNSGGSQENEIVALLRRVLNSFSKEGRQLSQSAE